MHLNDKKFIILEFLPTSVLQQQPQILHSLSPVTDLIIIVYFYVKLWELFKEAYH